MPEPTKGGCVSGKPTWGEAFDIGVKIWFAGILLLAIFEAVT
jgi:hypothetical protein